MVITIPTPASHALTAPEAGSTGLPARRSATTNRHTWKELPPNTSAIASWLSPRRTAAMPLLISGKALTRASTVAPKTTPLMPARLASALPLICSATPPASVTRQPARKMSSTVSVLAWV